MFISTGLGARPVYRRRGMGDASYYVGPPQRLVYGSFSPGALPTSQYLSFESDLQRTVAALTQNPPNGMWRDQIVASLDNLLPGETACEITPPDPDCANPGPLVAKYKQILDSYLKARGQFLLANAASYPGLGLPDLKPYLTQAEAATLFPSSSGAPVSAGTAGSSVQPGNPSSPAAPNYVIASGPLVSPPGGIANPVAAPSPISIDPGVIANPIAPSFLSSSVPLGGFNVPVLALGLAIVGGVLLFGGSK